MLLWVAVLPAGLFPPAGFLHFGGWFLPEGAKGTGKPGAMSAIISWVVTSVRWCHENGVTVDASCIQGSYPLYKRGEVRAKSLSQVLAIPRDSLGRLTTPSEELLEAILSTIDQWEVVPTEVVCVGTNRSLTRDPSGTLRAAQHNVELSSATFAEALHELAEARLAVSEEEVRALNALMSSVAEGNALKRMRPEHALLPCEYEGLQVLRRACRLSTAMSRVRQYLTTEVNHE